MSADDPRIQREPLTREREDQQHLVQHTINANVKYVTDEELYGVMERWEYPKGKGDCEDYALAKMKLLRDYGWPRASMDIAICRTETGGLHAVMVSHTDRGDYILDNRQTAVWPWKSLPYKWVEMSVGGLFTEGNWRAIDASAAT